MLFRDALMAERGVDRRSERRYEMPTGVVLKVITGDQFLTSRIEDISLGGACVRLNAPLDCDQDIELAHPRIGRIRGSCVWSDGNRIGELSMSSSAAWSGFDQKILTPPDRFRTIRSSAPSPSRSPPASALMSGSPMS